MRRSLTTIGLNSWRRSFAVLFVPVVVLHLAWVTPVVEWSCLCPENQPNHRCCCNCPKCVKNRGGFKSFCHQRWEERGEKSSGTGRVIWRTDFHRQQCNRC